MIVKRIALIGGAGFIGHNLAVALKKAGHVVHVIDSLNVNNLLAFYPTDHEVKNRERYLKMITDRLDLFRKHEIPLCVQDARDYHQLTRVLNTISPQVVVHLAAVAHAGRSNKDPYSTFDHSLRTLENALDSVRESVEHFVYLSSSMVYGDFLDGQVIEESICEPVGIYGALKFSGEKIVIAYHQAFDLPYTIIRPSALYGERCVSRRVAQIFIENAMAGSKITIQGNGSDRLDFTYIRDLTQGIRRIIESDHSRNQIFNLTYGESRSLSDLAGVLSTYFPALEIEYIPKDKLTPTRGTLCVDKARRVVGYAPQYPLEKGIREYVRWYKSQWKNGLIRLSA